MIDACAPGPTARAQPSRSAPCARPASTSLLASKAVDDADPATLDLVVTVCGHADENCPVFPGGARVIHRGFDDPPKLAKGAASDDDAMPHYRRVRDEIRAFFETLPEVLRDAGIAAPPRASR